MNTYPFDALRDSFLKFVADGMTYEEALEQFNEEDFRRAAWNEDTRLIRFEEAFHLGKIELAGNHVTNDERMLPSLFDLLVKANGEKRNGVNGADYQQALDLWQAGWKSEAVTPDGQVMSWYWRAPSKRPPRPGRRYLSTNQAWNALQKLNK